MRVSGPKQFILRRHISTCLLNNNTDSLHIISSCKNKENRHGGKGQKRRVYLKFLIKAELSRA